ncbi:MAG: G protein-coupled receptor LGR4, partial [Phycisphaerae bacterium]
MFTLCFASAGPVTLAADAAAAPEIKTQADFEAAVAAADPAVKEALRAHGPAILAAVTRRPHVEFVVAALDKASASYEKANATPEALRKALGRDLPAFDTLKTVNLGMAALGVKGKRTTDPFDHAFYEHVGEITDLESLTIINTTAQDADLAPLAKLRGLKALNIINQGKLTDEGLVHMKGLSRLERFAYVGTQLKGHPFKEFAGWTRLKSASFRGSKIDDEGIAALCDHFPALESISLAHANFTDAGAATL